MDKTKRPTARKVVISVINKLKKHEDIDFMDACNLVSIIQCKNQIINKLLPEYKRKFYWEVNTDIGWDVL